MENAGARSASKHRGLEIERASAFSRVHIYSVTLGRVSLGGINSFSNVCGREREREKRGKRIVSILKGDRSSFDSN